MAGGNALGRCPCHWGTPVRIWYPTRQPGGARKPADSWVTSFKVIDGFVLIKLTCTSNNNSIKLFTN